MSSIECPLWNFYVSGNKTLHLYSIIISLSIQVQSKSVDGDNGDTGNGVKDRCVGDKIKNLYGSRKGESRRYVR